MLSKTIPISMYVYHCVLGIVDGCTCTYKDLYTRTFLVHVVGSRTTVMRASHDRHCTSLLSKQLAGLFAYALASKGTLDTWTT